MMLNNNKLVDAVKAYRNLPQFMHITLTLKLLWLAGILMEPYDTFGLGPGFSFFAAHITEMHAAAVCWVIGAYGFAGAFFRARWFKLSGLALTASLLALIGLGTHIGAHGTILESFAIPSALVATFLFVVECDKRPKDD